MKTVFISIVIPAYKEAKRIGKTLLSLDKYFKSRKYSYEIIVVNDGSPDNLVDVVKRYASKIKNLKIISNEVNQGKGHAVKRGMIEARGRYRLFMDADNSVSILNLDRFLEEIAKGSEVVIGSIEIGSEKKDEHNGFMRSLLSKLSKLPVRILATPGIYDTQRGFKLFTRRAANIIFPKQTINRFAFDIEVLVIALANKLKIKEIPVAFDNPPGSTVGASAYVQSLGDLVRISLRKIAGVYRVHRSRSIINVTAGRVLVNSLVGVLLFCMVVVTVFLIRTGIGIQERAVAVEGPLVLSTPKSSSELHISTLDSAPSWLYLRKPMTKSDTGSLILFSLLLILIGSDLVAGIISPRLYAYARKIASRHELLPAHLSYEGRGQPVERKLTPHVIA